MFKTSFVLFIMLLSSISKPAYSETQEFIENVKNHIASFRHLCQPDPHRTISCPTPHLHQLDKASFTTNGKNFDIAPVNQISHERFLDNWDYVVRVLLGSDGNHGFLDQELTKKVFTDWVLSEGPSSSLQATDFNDLYKASMNGVIQDISKKVLKNKDEKILVSFASIVRSADPNLDDLYTQPEYAHIKEELEADIALLGKRHFSRETLEMINDTKFGGLRPVEWDEDEIKAMVKAGHQYLPEIKLAKAANQDGSLQRYFISTGPWEKVSWLETPLIQILTKSLVKARQLKLGISDEEWYARALVRLAMVVKVSNDIYDRTDGERQQKLKSFLFSGRRSPKLGFHLLTHTFLVNASHPLKSFAGTSSLFARRILSQPEYASLLEQSSHKNGIENILNLVGTHAHEGSMVLQSYLSEEDKAALAPISSIVWHMNYWLKTGILTVLPDTLGSQVFAYMLQNLYFPSSFVEAFNQRHQEKICTSKPIYFYIKTARQDSGSVLEFKNLFQGKSILASEISTIQDLSEVWERLEIDQIGAGGVFGEKDWNDPSIVAKAVEVHTLKGKVLVSTEPTSKLGDGWFPKDLKPEDYLSFIEKNDLKVDKLSLSPRLSLEERTQLVKQYLQLGTYFSVNKDSTDYVEKMQIMLEDAWNYFK
ncbi:MAG: hypothetical protein HRU09_15610 [Oligoflexales bacterium]|nr:hypothetical protein [Oligoflexales bacterium]